MAMKRDKILSGLAYLIIGILFFAAPTTSAKILASTVGIVLILQGLVRAFAAWRMKGAGLSRTIIIVLAAALLILGIFLLANPGFLIAYYYIVFGLIMIANALVNLFGVLRGEIRVSGNRTIYLILSAVLLVFGVIVLFHPFAASDALMRLVGTALIACGIADLWIAFQIKP